MREAMMVASESPGLSGTTELGCRFIDKLAPGPAESRRESRIGRVRRRHVIYVEGYDQRGAETYHHLFQRSCDRFRRVWPVGLSVEPIELDSEDLAHWCVEMRNANWQVATHYDFLRLERFIRSDLASPIARHIRRSLAWILDDLASGALLRILRASWRFGLHLLLFQFLLLAWLLVSAAIGLGAFHAVADALGLPMPLGIAASIAAALASLFALRPLARRGFVLQITSCWVALRRYARGRATWLDQSIEVGARRLVSVAQTSEADELAVIGHSTGCIIAMAVVARALELDPELGRRGPRLVLLTLGSVMPAVALHPAAERVRAIVGRLAVEPTLAWIDHQSRKDVMNFTQFDPVADIGVQVGARRCNPLIWPVRFKDMVSPDQYRRLRRSFFRLHFQYIMSGERPTAHDYVLLVSGPAAIADWSRRHEESSLAFIQDAGPEDACANAIGEATSLQ